MHINDIESREKFDNETRFRSDWNFKERGMVCTRRIEQRFLPKLPLYPPLSGFRVLPFTLNNAV